MDVIFLIHKMVLRYWGVVPLVLLAYYYRRQILYLLHKKDTWAVVAMLLCFSMMSGQMWNKMRKPIFCYEANEGPVLISNGQKKQYLAESYIMAVLNCVAVLGMILTIEGAGGVRTERDGSGKRRRNILMLAGSGLTTASFAVIVAVFRIKRPWYPYGF